MFSNELVSKALQTDNSPRLTDSSLSPLTAFPPIRFKVPRLRRHASPSAFLRVAPQVSSPGRIATLLFTPSRERNLSRPRLELHKRSIKISPPAPQITRSRGLDRKPSPPRMPCAPLRLPEQESGEFNGKGDLVSPSQVGHRRFRSPSGALPINRAGRIRLASLYGPR